MDLAAGVDDRVRDGGNTGCAVRAEAWVVCARATPVAKGACQTEASARAAAVVVRGAKMHGVRVGVPWGWGRCIFGIVIPLPLALAGGSYPVRAECWGGGSPLGLVFRPPERC
ncbi:hypothetical protein [Acetobacter okinawensis]|uniref:hypothetical protein n=1 Tax=Acetobacter okinawensis TaxID=1076594 RepID=UPI001902917F|nr:hypothetical protein [Acetobacter okinawensis]